MAFLGLSFGLVLRKARRVQHCKKAYNINRSRYAERWSGNGSCRNVLRRSAPGSTPLCNKLRMALHLGHNPCGHIPKVGPHARQILTAEARWSRIATRYVTSS